MRIDVALRLPFVVILLLGASPGARAAGEGVEQRVVLVGDAGSTVGGRALLESLGELLRDDGIPAERTALVYLGDNLYRDGPAVVDEAGRSPELQQQLHAGRASGLVLFLPGNHDWGISSTGRIVFDEAVTRLRAEERFVEEARPLAGRWLPRAGCPGPEGLELGAVKLVALDSAWWFLDRQRREALAREQDCPQVTEAEVLDALKRELACAAEPCLPRILVAHHPLESHGRHGGHFEAREHLLCADAFPIPIGCSAYLMARRAGFINQQDQSSSPYRHLIESLRGAMEGAPPIAFAAGHEHTLEVLDDPQAGVLLVSGGGSEPKAVEPGPRFRTSALGFMTLDFLAGGHARLRVHARRVPHGRLELVYEERL
jgi:hypothetical protein